MAKDPKSANSRTKEYGRGQLWRRLVLCCFCASLLVPGWFILTSKPKEVKRSNVGHTSTGLNIFMDKDHLRNCITGDVIGRKPRVPRKQRLTVGTSQSLQSHQERQNSFQKVFDTRAWGGKKLVKKDSELSSSGGGSSLDYSQEVVGTLHVLITQLKTYLGKSHVKVLDLPCGDMRWMSRFLMTRKDIDYTGVDVVPNIINRHKITYKDYPWKFRLHDILKEPVNASFDIILCRMLLQHLGNTDVLRILKRFSESGSLFLLTTTFSGHDRNRELNVKASKGRFRKLNLEIPPISLESPLCVQWDGVLSRSQFNLIGLWQLPLMQIPGCGRPHPRPLAGTNFTVYSCLDWSLA